MKRLFVGKYWSIWVCYTSWGIHISWGNGWLEIRLLCFIFDWDILKDFLE